MKKTIFSPILIVLISLCAIPNFQSENVLQAGISIIDIGSPDIFLKIEAVPQEVRSGRSVLMTFEMRNKNSFDLRNINVIAYDMCVFEGEGTKEIETLKANSTTTWMWKWDSNELDMDRECVIKFRTEYTASNSVFQDIAVLSESEYQQRELDGTLQNVPIQFSFPSSPLQLSIRFSDSQPFIDNEEYNMFIEYNDVGEGIIEVEKGSIGIFIPSNIKSMACNNYGSSTFGCCEFVPWCMMVPSIDKCSYIAASDWYPDRVCHSALLCITPEEYRTAEGVDFEENFIALNKGLTFINKRGPPTTCTFTTSSTKPINIKTVRIDAEYTYKLDNLLNIRVKR